MHLGPLRHPYPPPSVSVAMIIAFGDAGDIHSVNP